MRSRPVLVLVAMNVVTALVVLGGFLAITSNGKAEREALRAEIGTLRTELAQAQSDAAAAGRRADVLQARVDVLTAALLAAGVDPATVVMPAQPTTPASTTPAPSRSSTAAAPRPRPTPSPRRPPAASPSPSPSPCTVRNPITGACLVPPDRKG
jgi:hypothetical protein